MIRIQFKCRLLSDLIINQKSASEGPNETLDFIPGNCFLGIAATGLYQDESEESMELFHSGNVRFSDAHPSFNNIRSLKSPLSLHSPKLSANKSPKELYQLFATDVFDDVIISKQLKQERRGFICFEDKNGSISASKVAGETNFALKSEYNKEKRRSQDGILFGYESLTPIEGIEYYFDIEFANASSENDDIVKKVTESICGKKRIGRSKSAEYGSVFIERSNYEDCLSTDTPILLTENNTDTRYYSVYADGRLIFLDDEGLPKLGNISAQDLGFEENAVIRWDKSQTRQFKYSPWNNKRKSFDADRYGFEKGSVFVVQADKTPSETKYVGNYNNEGFGRIIYNPLFLKANKDGSAVFTLNEMPDLQLGKKSVALNEDTPLLQYLIRQSMDENYDFSILGDVQSWVESNFKFFRKISLSQWGSIRTKAYQNHEYKALVNSINDFIERDTIGAQVWKNNKKAKELLQKFYTVTSNEKDKEFMYRRVITLASLMQKTLKDNQDKKKQ